MDEVRPHLVDMARDRARADEGQSDLGICGTGQRAEARGNEEADLGAELRQLLRKPLIGADHPIHLGVPGIGRDEDAHQAAASSSSAGDFGALTPWCGFQRMISKIPSSVSATAVQLSTQSPVLM